MTTGNSDFVIFLNGSYGVGKTTVLDHIGQLLVARQQPFSLIDVDWFHRSWPVAVDDPDNHIIEAKNIAAVWRNYRAAGPRQLIISGVITNAADRDRYSNAVELPVRSIRLTADVASLAERLRGRYDSGRAEELEWHLSRCETLQRQLADANLDEATVATDGRTAASVAEAVLHHFQ